MSPCVSRQPGTFTSAYPASSKRDEANAGGMCAVCQCSSVLSIGNRSRCDGTTHARHTPSSDCRNVPNAPSTVMWSVCAGNRLTAKTAGSTSQRTLGCPSRARSPPAGGAMSPFPAASEAVPRGAPMCVVVSDCAIPAPHRKRWCDRGLHRPWFLCVLDSKLFIRHAQEVFAPYHNHTEPPSPHQHRYRTSISRYFAVKRHADKPYEILTFPHISINLFTYLSKVSFHNRSMRITPYGRMT